MAIYNYVGLNKKGEVVRGNVEAETPKEARQVIKELGYVPTKVTVDSADENSPDSKKKVSNALQSLTLKEKLDFTSTFLIFSIKSTSGAEQSISTASLDFSSIKR